MFETTRYEEKFTGVSMSHSRLHPIRKDKNSTTPDVNLNLSTSIDNPSSSASPDPNIKPFSTTEGTDYVIKNYSDPVTFAIGVKQGTSFH